MTAKFMGIDIQVTKKNPCKTLFAGLVPFLKMVYAMKLPDIINKSLHVRKEKGYKDSDHLMALIGMQITGGTTLDELASFKEKVGLQALGFNVPSPSATREYMTHYHNSEEECKQKQGSVYIPKENEHLSGFRDIHAAVFQCAFNLDKKKSITLDQDATYIPTETKCALYNYEGKKSFSALNTYCAEYDIMVGTEYRDGNVNAGYGQLEELKRVLSKVPEGIEKVSLRSDSAGYQQELMEYCAEGKDSRFGVIDISVSCKVNKDFRESAQAVPAEEWKPVMKKTIVHGVEKLEETGQECATVSYVPTWTSNSKEGVEYRFIAIREKYEAKKAEEDNESQLPIPELIKKLEAGSKKMKKLHLTEMRGEVYKVFGIVTNRQEEDGGELVRWHYERCGKSEEMHRILKDEAAGGHIASRKFGANAAWWNIVVLAVSLNNIFKHYFLPKECGKMRLKGLRYQFYVALGQLISHARKTILRVSAEKVAGWYRYARDRLMSFCAATS